SARRGARIVAVSRATRDAVVAHSGADPARIDVVPEGVDAEMFHPPTEAEVEAFRRDHGIEAPWIAFLGTIEPRKNVPRLMEAFTRLDFDGVLLIAGRRGWGRPLPEAPRVRRLGYLPDGERRALPGGAA